ncbi:MAG: DUF4271 domain-containing protein [Cyclobacteriaceae bacterium]|nr:DUF4271 domain-containing protein [Cyclobacteriaceae bacterium]
MRLLLLLLTVSQIVFATPIVVKDLRQNWLQYQENTYQAVDPSNLPHLKTVYFYVKATSFKGQHLMVTGTENWDLFINGKLVSAGIKKSLNLDSLSALYSAELFFGIYAENGVRHLTTQIVSPNTSLALTSLEISQRPPTFFRDYAIIASAILLIFLLILFRTNPQLTLDYFSFAKIFSVQERNENLLASRITSSVNLLFYLFCALLTGFLLSTVFYFAGSYFLVAKFIEIQSFGGSFLIWIKLSLFILALLASKLIIVLFFSSVFDFRETVSFQFFNFLRFVLFTAVMMAMLSLTYFVFKGEQAIFYERLIILALLLLSAGSIMVLIKLLARAPFSFFHLFSYLCASEIIPLVIIIKIFF